MPQLESIIGPASGVLFPPQAKRAIANGTRRRIDAAHSSHRVATVLHELFHISRKFDGTLDRARRHSRMGPKFDARFKPLEKRLWHALPEGLRDAFSYDGEVRVLQWLERPTAWLPGERSSG